MKMSMIDIVIRSAYVVDVMLLWFVVHERSGML